MNENNSDQNHAIPVSEQNPKNDESTVGKAIAPPVENPVPANLPLSHMPESGSVGSSPLSMQPSSPPPVGSYAPYTQQQQSPYSGHVPSTSQNNIGGYQPPNLFAPYGSQNRPISNDQTPYGPPTFAYLAPTPKEKYVYSPAEKLILPLVFILAIFFDRLILANLFSDHSTFFSSIFSMVFMVGYYIFQWDKVKKDKFLWFISGLIFLLCIWNLIFDYQSDFGTITLFVVPTVIMAHFQLSKNDLTIKDVLALFVNWVLGWIVQPFSALPHYTGVNNAVFRPANDEKRHLAKRILSGLPFPFLHF